jgi:citrate synthase
MRRHCKRRSDAASILIEPINPSADTGAMTATICSAALVSSGEACAILGITRQTLYSYVSRGLLRALPGADHRTHRYRRSEVERLAQQARQRKPREAARGVLDFGLPVLESALTLIEEGLLYYRGVSALELAESASLEEVARLLWRGTSATDADDPFAATCAPNALSLDPQEEPMQRALAHFAGGDEAAADDPVQSLRRMAACLLGAAPLALPLHRQCALAWGVDEAGAQLLRGALVLCADHELNASSFAARVVASTGATLSEAVRGGLAALSGPHHGQMTALVEELFDRLDAALAVQRWIGKQRFIPGFGHPLYPEGDPRAAWILERLPEPARHPAVLEAVAAQSGEAPSLDYALVALRRHLGLPRGSAFVLFALGRTAGWIAHALEQRGMGLIRPRAAYVGRRP